MFKKYIINDYQLAIYCISFVQLCNVNLIKKVEAMLKFFSGAVL